MIDVVKVRLLDTAAWLLKLYVGSGVYERVSKEAFRLIFTNLTGDEKMASLKAFIASEGLVIHKIVRDAVVAFTRLRFEL